MTFLTQGQSSAERPTLDELGRLHGTDKSSKNHAYLRIYEQFFAGLRDSEVKILEIGVKEGASLCVWRDYFPRAEIVGVDIRPFAKKFAGERISIEVADQGVPAQLDAVTARYGPFDIVVEDGSHRWSHQVLAIKRLLPAVKSGGFFISEDLQVSFPPLAEQYAHGADRSAFEVLKELAELVLRRFDRAQPARSDPELSRLVPLTDWVLFLRHACILRRL